VARNDRAMADYLRHHFTDAPEVEVILDRRFGERRRNAAPVPEERRRPDRRTRPEVDARLPYDSHVFLSLP
jgi:hypothetical protein